MVSPELRRCGRGLLAGGYHGRGRCHILGSRGVGRDVAH